MPDTATVSFVGENGPVSGIRSCRFPLSRGVTPSSFVLYVLPQPFLDVPKGVLTFSQGNTQIRFTGCALATAFVRHQYDGKWPIMAVYGFDRRWKWAGKTISGDWNRRLADGTVDQATQKTPAELATLLFQALGEGNVDVSLMPGSVKPRAKWLDARADLALAELCEKVACEVVLNHQLDRFEVWPLGVGATTPTQSYELLGKYYYVPRAYVPNKVVVLCGPSKFQSKLKLSAVARNYNNPEQHLVSFMEYVPAGGWGSESWISFPSVTNSNQQINAFEGVWRDYRIVGQQNGSVQPPNCSTPVSAIDQYLLTDTLLETENDLEGYKRNLPCYVDGDYWSYADLPTNVSGQRYTGQFKLSIDRRLVSFPQPMFKLDSTGLITEPALYLTTGYSVVDNSNALVSIQRSGNIGGGGGTLVVRHPELFAAYSTTTTPQQQTNTESQATAEADAYVTLFQQKYQKQLASEIRYPGLFPFTCDGNVAQVSWSWAANRLPETMVCEQEELDVTSVSRAERRRSEILAQLQERYL